MRGWRRLGNIFPGHGAVVTDSHVELPVDRREYTAILDDLTPYEGLVRQRLLAGVMTSHIVYRELDERPATFSAWWLKTELRQRLGFEGAVFSDDLSMQATRPFGSMPERVRAALGAGCDMAIVCNDRPAAQSAVHALGDVANPLSLVRLARLHGTGGESRETLRASNEWQQAHDCLERLGERPPARAGLLKSNALVVVDAAHAEVFDLEIVVESVFRAFPALP